MPSTCAVFRFQTGSHVLGLGPKRRERLIQIIESWGLPILANRVVIEDYDPRWPRIFEMLRSRIAIALDGVVDSIEHVGSTAVPGLAAKPVIDIDVLLGSASDLPLAIARLADWGSEYRGDLGVLGREAFRAMPDDFSHHYMYAHQTSREYRRHIAFRDHLRAHTDDASAYASLKRSLAIRFGTDREGYNQAKSKFVEGILERTLKA